MSPVRACLLMFRIKLLMTRDAFPTLLMVQFLFAVGMTIGFGYFIPGIRGTQALFLITGVAAQTVVTVGLVMLPQMLSEERVEGLAEYWLTLPISREAYLVANVLFVGVLSLPATALAIAFGAWHYDVALAVEPSVVVVAVLAVLSLAGVGVSMAVLSPSPQLTNMLTQVVIFYVLLFSPVLFPKENLPVAFQHVSTFLPPTYVADAMRGSLTDLPGTHLVRSLLVMSGFAAASVVASAVVIRRRG